MIFNHVANRLDDNYFETVVEMLNVGSHFGVRIQFEQNQCFMLSHFS
jgi:hypothetical protein